MCEPGERESMMDCSSYRKNIFRHKKSSLMLFKDTLNVRIHKWLCGKRQRGREVKRVAVATVHGSPARLGLAAQPLILMLHARRQPLDLGHPQEPSYLGYYLLSSPTASLPFPDYIIP